MTPQLAAEMADLEAPAPAEPTWWDEYAADLNGTKTVFEAADHTGPEQTRCPLVALMDPARTLLLDSIRAVAPRARLVRTTPYRRRLDQDTQTIHTVMVLRTDRREAVLPKGGVAEILRLLRNAIPGAPWDSVALNYDTRTGFLTRHTPHIPASLPGVTR